MGGAEAERGCAPATATHTSQPPNPSSQSVFHVAHLRGLFPDACFKPVDMTNLDGLRIQVLQPTCPASRALVEWVEVGVADALAKRFLSRMTFGVAADEACTRLLEEYVFDFAYGGNGAPSVAVSRGGRAASARHAPPAPDARATVASVKHQIVTMIRTLVQVAGTLTPVPADRFLFIKLAYTDDAPADYEPPRFKPLPLDAAAAHFPHKPFVLPAGALATAHHAVGLCVKTALDAATPAAGMPASQPVASADCEASAMTGATGTGAAAPLAVDSSPPGVTDALATLRNYVAVPGRGAVELTDVMTRFASLSVAALARACDALVDEGVLRREADDRFAVAGGAPRRAAARRGGKLLGTVAASRAAAADAKRDQAAAAAAADASADGGIASAGGTAATASARGAARRAPRAAVAAVGRRGGPRPHGRVPSVGERRGGRHEAQGLHRGGAHPHGGGAQSVAPGQDQVREREWAGCVCFFLSFRSSRVRYSAQDAYMFRSQRVCANENKTKTRVI